MKRVFIDRQKGVVLINGKKIPGLLLRMMRGAVGKRFVVKQYKGGRVVVTRYPHMRGIVASERQRVRRNLFREAVVYARWIVGDEERKKVFRKSLPRKKRKHVYQAAIRLYMSMQGDTKWLRKQLAVRAMMQSGQVEWTGKAMVGSINGARSNVNGVDVKWEKRSYDQLDYGWIKRDAGQTEDVFVKCSDAVW